MNSRILAIAATPYFSDRGGHIRIYNVLKYLEKNGYQIVLCTYGLGYNPKGVNFMVIRAKNLPWYKKISPGASLWKPILDLLLLFTTLKQYLKLQPDILQPFQYESLAITVIIKLITFSKARIIFDCQGSVTEEIQQYNLKKKSILKKLLLPIINIAERFLLLFPEKVLCSSINSYNFLKEKFHIKESKLILLEDGIDMDLFDNVKKDQNHSLKLSLGIPNNNRVVIYTGTLNKAKGVDRLLEALPEVLKNIPNVTFVFAGYGELQEQYERKLSDYIKSKQVIFLGKTHYFDLPSYLKIADFGIDPKLDSSESSGKLFNYIAANLPVICFKSDLNFSILGDSGKYVNSFNSINENLLEDKTSNLKLPDSIYWSNIIKKYAF